MNSYNAFAEVYDRLTDNVEYKKRAVYLHTLLNENAIASDATVLDLACGTGNLTVELACLGYDMIGVDISTDMLSKALGKVGELPILLLRQNMTELDLYGTIDAAVCTLDSLNHLDSSESVRKAITKVGLFMNPGGIFIFDVNTIYKHRTILADNTFVYDCDDVYCVWQNRLNPDDSVDINLDIFEKIGKTYYRSGESFKEKAYPLDDIKKWLNEAEFKIIDIYDEMTFKKLNEKTERAVFVAKYFGKDGK